MYGSIPPSLVPAARRRRAKLDKHAERQRQHKANLKKKKAPQREDFAMAALDACLLLRAYDPKGEFPKKLYCAVLGQLSRAGFDREQCVIRMDRMVENIQEDLDKRRRKREFAADRAAAAAKANAGATVGEGSASPGGAM